MKKFEMLDKFLEASSKGLLKDPTAPKAKRSKVKRDEDDYGHEKRAPTPIPEESEPLGPDQPLNERQLALLFKMTSSFSVPTDGFIESSFDGYYAPEDFELEDEEKYVLAFCPLQFLKHFAFWILVLPFESHYPYHYPYIFLFIFRI